MMFFVMLHLFLFVLSDSREVKCPLISRTRYKEQRSFGYASCSGEWNKCFQGINLTEITLSGQYAFLYASGCIDSNSLKSLNISKPDFVALCAQKGVSRCRHRYSNGRYAGSFCCENDDSDVFKSWLFDIFFGENREMEYELNATINFVQNEQKGKTDLNAIGSIPFAIGLPFVTIFLFISLAFLQFYHINDGVIS